LKENFDRFTHDNFKEKEMADFRKMLFVLAGLLIIIGTASAQTTCIAFVANQPIMRQEGAAEPAGDIVINCSGTPSAIQQATNQTVTLYASATITSRLLVSSSSTIPTWTDAALFINDSGTPVQGQLQNGALVFSGFGLPNAASFSLRVTNVRINANALSAGSFVTGTLLATFPLQNQSGLVLGAVQSSLSVTVSTSSPSIQNLAQCSSTGTAPGVQITNLTVKELVQSAFKDQGTATNNTIGSWYQNGINTESQTVFSTPAGWTNSVAATPGLADNPTRIRINLSNIPAGVTVFMPISITNSLGSQLVASAGGDTGGFTAATGTTISGVANPSGMTAANVFVALTASGSVTYQIAHQNGGALDSFQFPIVVQYTYAAPSTPNVGSVLVSGTYAPTTAESTTLIPRFADTSVLTTLFTISACQTDLLFTFLTNQAGFDTGFAISNTSSDPFGTSLQNGTCLLSWYGSGSAAGTSTTTSSVAAGTVYASLVSTLAPGFQGYMIAQCNFQYGHGFAFISDGYGQPGKGLSQGYLAQVIPTPALNGPARNASDSSRSAVNSGEGLGN
jgi:hypothetical protein